MRVVGGLFAIVDVMLVRFVDSLETQKLACTLLGDISSYKSYDWRWSSEAGVAEAVVATLIRYKKESSVIETASHALWGVVADEPNHYRAVQCGAIEAMTLHLKEA